MMLVVRLGGREVRSGEGRKEGRKEVVPGVGRAVGKDIWARARGMETEGEQEYGRVAWCRIGGWR